MTAEKQNPTFKTSAKMLLISCVFLGLSACSSPEEMKLDHYETGMELIAEGDYIKANLEFRNALQIDDSYVDAWYGLSLVEEENEAWLNLNSVLNKIIELDPANIDANVRLGKLMLMVDQLERAVEISEGALLIDNQNPEVLALRAGVLLKLGDTEGALDSANRALEIEPGNISAIQILAAERYSVRDFEGALEFITQSNEDISQNRDLTLISIVIYEAMNDLDSAEGLYRSLIERNPDDEELRNALVNFHIKHSDLAAAESEIRSIAELNPANYQNNINVVRFLNTYKSSAEAEAELNTLIQRGTDVVRYQLALSEFKLANGERDEAVDVLNTIVERTGSSEDGLIARGRLGELAMAEGRFDDAETIVAGILEIDGANITALEIRGSMNLENDRYDNAIQDLRIVLNEKPDAQRAALLLARAYELSGSIELADDTLADALRYSENNVEVAITYANFLVKQSAVPRAEDILISVLNVNPNSLDLLRELARVRLMRQNWIGAQQVADAIRALDSDDIGAAEIEGMALSGQQNYEQSITLFRNAYQQSNGTGSNALAALIGSYMRANRAQDAKDFLAGLLEENENNYQALLLLGQVQMGQSETDDAIATFEKAVEVNPANAAGYMNLIGHYVRVDDLPKALELADQGLSVATNPIGLNLIKANIYERDRNYEMAIGIYEDMMEMEQINDVVINNLASLLSEHREDDASMQRARELASRFRQSSVPHFKDTLGWIYYKTGDIQAATSILQDAVEQMPNVAIFRYHLGMSYMAEERNAAAIREFEEVVKISDSQPFEQLEEVKGLLAQLNQANEPS